MAKLRNYSLRYKRRVLLKYDEFRQNKYKTAKFFSISRVNVIRWTNNRESIFATSKTTDFSTLRIIKPNLTRCKNPQGEKRLYDWFCGLRENRVGVSRLALLDRMHKDQQENIPETPVKIGYSWLNRFMRRYDLSLRRISGSGRAFPANTKEIIEAYLEELYGFITKHKYNKNQIFNFDETCIYMDMPSKYTVSHVGARKTFSKSTGKEKARYFCFCFCIITYDLSHQSSQNLAWRYNFLFSNGFYYIK